nr:14145_t:CDS:2 [Entrophospora candida]
MSATVNEHIKHEIINSNTSMDNDSTAEGSNDSCSGESNLTKSNNYGFGYVTKHLNVSQIWQLEIGQNPYP